jgi:dolichol-phosphate mannosyltransferase
MTDVVQKPPGSFPLIAEQTPAPQREMSRTAEAFSSYPTRRAESLWLSVVIPTRNESGNIEPLLHRLAPIATAPNVEIIFVDDSSDDTPDVISHAGDDYHCPIHLLHREPGHREGGLGGAVLEGLRAAHGEWIVVMDGDLQHPPETIPDLLDAAEEFNRDLVVASRYCEDGDSGSFGQIRSLISRGSTIAAKLLFPRRLRNVDDPMSGFFLVRRDALDLEQLHPNGFKILLEIVGRTPNLRVGSVPFTFGERFAEESKASVREGLRYVHLLCALRCGPQLEKFGKFGLVGISGLLVNSLLLAFWTETIGIYYLASLVLATQGSSLWNFFLSEFWVFRGAKQDGSTVGRCVKFLLMNSAALLARGPIVFVLTSILGFNYLISNVASMAVILVLRFVVADSLIWKISPPQPVQKPATLPSPVSESEVAA